MNKSKMESKQTFFKSFVVLLIIYVVGISAILRANFNYFDDMGRVAEGYRGWDNFGRYISYYLSVLIHADNYLTDISPLPQLIAVAIMALAGVIVQDAISDKRIFSIKKAIALIPFGLSPYFLACISYKYDSPYMALSVLASVCPLLLYECSIPKYLGATILGTLAMCTTYQAFSGVYPMLIVLICVRKWNKGEDLIKIVKSLIISGLGYILGLVLFKVAFMDRLHGYRSASIVSFSQLLPTYCHNLYKYLEILKNDLKNEWFVLIILMGISFVVILIKESQRKKIIAVIVAVLTFIAMFVLSFGIYPFLQEPFFSPRGMYGIGVFLSYIGVYIMDHSNMYLAKIVNILLCWGFFVFSFTYGNALVVQSNYTDFRIHMVMSDINELEIFTDDKKTEIQIFGSIGRSPIIKNMPQDYQILNRLIPETFHGGGAWGQCGFYNYYGIKNVSSNWRSPSNIPESELPIIKDTMYHTIKGNDDVILIELK